MVRKMLVCVALSASFVMAHMPRELQLRVAELAAQGDLREISETSYKPGGICAALFGFNKIGQKVAFVALQYDGHKWTPFKSLPLDQQNDKFGIFSDGVKVVIIQSNSKIDHKNAVGFHVELDRRTFTVTLRPVELGSFRVPNEQVDDWITF